MSIIDESVESAAAATSTCPSIGITATTIGSGLAGNLALAGLTPATTVGSAATTSQVVIEAFATLIGSAAATNTVVTSAEVVELLQSSAEGRSTLLAALNVFCSALANSVATASLDVPVTVIASAIAASTVTPHTTATLFSNGIADATSSTPSLGLSDFLTGSADASATVVLMRRVDQQVTQSASGTSTVTPSVVPAMFLLIGTAQGESLVELQTDRNLTLFATAEGSGEASYKDATRVAWVMNTETTAASWYDNYDFESIAQIQDKVLAVGPDGLYELSGDDDAGDQVDAELVGGFLDFGSANQKHVDALYFGYTSEGKLAVTAETKDSGHSPYTYYLEQRPTSAPKNGRVVPGKGMVGRYWRFTIRNVAGADFEVYSSAIDIAVSSRRL